MEKALAFLRELEENNNREWYHDNKAFMQEATEDFVKLMSSLMAIIAEFDAKILEIEPKNLMFRLAKDMRFSKDKTPFNPSFRAVLSSGGKRSIPAAYYLAFQPGNRTYLGAGFHETNNKEAITLIRDHIVSHGDQFQKIITQPDFAKHLKVEGEALKNVPKGYDANHLQGEYLKNKSWYVFYPFSDEDLLDEKNFNQKARDAIYLMKPFDDFLNEAMKSIL